MTGFRQVSVLAAGNQVELLEELLFLADAQAVTLVDHGVPQFLSLHLVATLCGRRHKCRRCFHDERPESEILSDLATYFQRANLLIELPSHLTIVPDQDWVRISLDQFQPIHIGNFG